MVRKPGVVSFAGGTRGTERFESFPAVRAVNRARSLTGHEREHDREDERERATAQTPSCGNHGEAGVMHTCSRPSGTPARVISDDTILRTLQQS